MAVKKVSQREIVEVPFIMPEGGTKPHPALVLSTSELLDMEDGMFYAALISTENFHSEYTIQIQDRWLNKPMNQSSYIVTHIITFFNVKVFTTHNSRLTSSLTSGSFSNNFFISSTSSRRVLCE